VAHMLEKRPHGLCGAWHTAPDSAAAVLTRLPKVVCTAITARPDFERLWQSHRRINQRRATSGWHICSKSALMGCVASSKQQRTSWRIIITQGRGGIS